MPAHGTSQWKPTVVGRDLGSLQGAVTLAKRKDNGINLKKFSMTATSCVILAQTATIALLPQGELRSVANMTVKFSVTGNCVAEPVIHHH